MNKTFGKITKKISGHLLEIGTTMFIADILLLTAYFMLSIESNVPLWVSLFLLIAGTSLVVAGCKKASTY